MKSEILPLGNETLKYSSIKRKGRFLTLQVFALHDRSVVLWINQDLAKGKTATQGI